MVRAIQAIDRKRIISSGQRGMSNFEQDPHPFGELSSDCRKARVKM